LRNIVLKSFVSLFLLEEAVEGAQIHNSVIEKAPMASLLPQSFRAIRNIGRAKNRTTLMYGSLKDHHYF
jgi:hypothetical protein